MRSPLIPFLTVFALMGQPLRIEKRLCKGLYWNRQYGYSVTIPAGMECTGAAQDAPAHGCVVYVDGGWVAVDGSYSIDAELPRRRISGEFIRGNTRLGGLPAVESVLRDGKRIVRIVGAIRKTGKDAAPITYTIEADCPNDGTCTATLAQILRSFQLRSMTTTG